MKNILLISLVLFSPLSFAQTILNWSASTTGDRVITANEVRKFTEHVLLSDSYKGALFRESFSDFDIYEKKKEQWIKKNFPKALKYLAHANFLQYFAEKKSNDLNSFGRKVFFTTSKKDFNQHFNEVLNSVLAPYKKSCNCSGKTLTQNFIKRLKELDYPHQRGESAADIFESWKYSQKQKIKEDFRKKHLASYKNYLVQSYYKRADSYVTVIQIWEFFDKQLALAKKKIGASNITSEQAAKVMEENPLFKYVVNKVDNASLKSLGAIALNKYSAQAFDEAYNLIKDKFVPILNESQLSKFDKYENLAFEFSKEDSLEQLEIDRKNSLAKFIESGNFKDLATSKINDLAIAMKKDPNSRSLYNKRLKGNLLNAISNLRANLSNSSNLLNQEDDKIFEIYVKNQLSKDINFKDMSEYERTLTKFAIWSFQFEAKKVSFLDKDRYTIGFKSKDEDFLYSKIENHLLTEFKKGVLNIQLKKIYKKYSLLLKISPTGNFEDSVHNQKALDYLLD